MTETHDEPRALETSEAGRHYKVKVSDAIIFTITGAIILGLTWFILGRLNLKREVTGAKVVSDKVIANLATQNTAAIRALGDASFQQKNTAASLDSALTFHPENSDPIKFSAMYGSNKPTVVQQVVANNSRGQHVVFVYRYDKLKVDFFVQVNVAKAPGNSKWTLQALSAGPDESALLNQQQ